MKKGLRLDSVAVILQSLRLNDRPDEEGIKTSICWKTSISTGLNDRPDEEGIKTAIRHGIACGVRFERQT